jgi:hypothetical protein
LLGFIQAHYLPLALLTALLLGATCPSLGVAAAGLQIPTFTTFGIFVVQVGMSRQLLAASSAGRTHLFALCSSVCLTASFSQ